MSYGQIFLQINKTDLKHMFIFIGIAIAMAHMSAKLLKTEVYVVNLLVAIFGDQRRIKYIGEKG